MEENKHLIIDIEESELDFSDDSWKDAVKRDFQAIRNALEKNPNKESPAYYTWFMFFLKYGRAICSEEGKRYIKEHNTNVFNLIREAVGLNMSPGGAYTVGYKFYDECIKNSKSIDKAGISIHIKKNTSPKIGILSNKEYRPYLRAMRTKPFLLLAGISGTGKSRIVKQLAFDSCPSLPELRKDPASPGNYCLIEVKPNWHDSSELLGYESRIGGAHYQITPFVKFLVKALLYPEVPFFVCLDEMNLAPVEQYFAEFLSVLESRTKIGGHIVSESLIDASIFSNPKYESELKAELFDVKIEEEDSNGVRIYDGRVSEDALNVYEQLKLHGLGIPENVIVIGTVNMDETTHQFSRKVIDRAMTIEMNLPDGDPFMDFFTKTRKLEYLDEPLSPSEYLSSETRASDIMEVLSHHNEENAEWLKREVADILTKLNAQLEGTPFKVAFRVQNELLIYFFQIWRETHGSEWSEMLNDAVDQILMMKVLPRIEGDEELLEEPIEKLVEFTMPYPNAQKKIREMKERLDKSRFTSFWP